METINAVVQSIINDVSVEDLVAIRGKHTLPQAMRDQIMFAVVSETI